MPWHDTLPSSWQISPAAIEYMATLGQEQAPGLALQLTVSNPLTAGAELNMAFQPLNLDILCFKISHTLNIQTNDDSLAALESLSITLTTTAPGQSELEVQAPSLYGADGQKPLIEQIRVFFAHDISPVLASHKGGATLKELTNEGILFIEFFGGCQGCSLSSATLKSTIKERLQKRFPQVKDICDTTRHDEGENPYA